ncbi:MAG TPA: hypothetical protein VJ870_02285 [Amycolatopsis sp.]|nr:hypothetical protein [Amycolatopsis sp.]
MAGSPARVVLELVMRIRRDDTAPEAGEPAVSRRPLVLAGVAGFVVGVSVIGLLWGLSGDADAAAQDAKAACAALVSAMPQIPAGYIREAIGPDVVHHVVAARELSAAAADESDVYSDLADHLDGVSRMVLSLNFADPAGRRHLTLAEQFCAHV